MTKIVNPDMIVLAREARGLSQSQLAEKLNITQGALSKIENGMNNISLDLLSKISEILSYPEDFFFLQEELYGSGIGFIYHRSRKSLSKKIVDRIESQINIHRIVISRLLSSVEIDVNFPFCDIEQYDFNIEEITKAVRTTWHLPRGPIKDLTHVIEKAGGIVIKCDFGTPKIDALSQCIPGFPPLFFINKNIPGDRLRFSLAHELGHVIMHRIPRPTMEEEADRFAAKLLMPTHDISGSFYNVTLPQLASLKPYWKVSMAALLKRAIDLQKVNKRKEKDLWIQMSGYRLREPSELDVQAEEPNLLKRLIDIYSTDLKYSMDEISKVAGLHPEEFKENYLGEEKHLKLIRLN